MWITLGLIAAVLIWLISIYNNLVTCRNGYKNAFAQIDVQLERRHDLIPNVVEVAKTYMAHERDTLEAVIQARQQAVANLKQASANPGAELAMNNLSEAESGLSGALGKFQVVCESYPELKANENMQQLVEELSSTENRIAFARQAFNDAVMGYNNQRETFPNSIVAGFTGFTEARMLESLEATKRAVPQVTF